MHFIVDFSNDSRDRYYIYRVALLGQIVRYNCTCMYQYVLLRVTYNELVER